MKNKGKALSGILLASAFGFVLSSCSSNKHIAGEEWKRDASQHWHECVTKDHDDKLDVANHDFGDWMVITPANYGTTGTEKKTCSVCKYGVTRPIDALSAKENSIVPKTGISFSKTYDGKPISLTSDRFTFNGNQIVDYSYKVKGESGDFIKEAPANAGLYSVKVSVAGSKEWKAAETIIDYSVTAKPLSADLIKIYNGTKFVTGAAKGTIEGDSITVKATRTGKDISASIESLELIGEGKDNYSISKEDVNVRIYPRPAFSDTQKFTKAYDGTSEIIAGFGNRLIDGDEASIRIERESAAVGETEIKSVTAQGKDSANYSFDVSKITAEITQKEISTSSFHFSSYRINKQRTTVFQLNSSEHGIIEGEEVYVEVDPTNIKRDIPYNLVSDRENGDSRSVEVSLTGPDASNYKLVDPDKKSVLNGTKSYGKIDCKYYTGVLNVVSSTNAYGNFDFLNPNSSSNYLTIDDRTQGSFSDNLTSSERKNKQISLAIYAGKDKNGVKLAQYSRTGIETNGRKYTHSGATFFGDSGRNFILFENIQDYTNSAGYWIYEGPVDIYVDLSVTEMDIIDLEVDDSYATHFEKGKTVTLAYKNGPRDETPYEIHRTKRNGKVSVYDLNGEVIDLIGRYFSLQSEAGFIKVDVSEAEEGCRFELVQCSGEIPSVNEITIDTLGTTTTDKRNYAPNSVTVFKTTLKAGNKVTTEFSISGPSSSGFTRNVYEKGMAYSVFGNETQIGVRFAYPKTIYIVIKYRFSSSTSANLTITRL